MNDRDRLEQTLKAVREADSGRAAPDYLETRLRAAYRDHHTRPRKAFAVRWWIGAFASAALVFFAVWRFAAPAAVEAPNSAPPAVTASVPPVVAPPAPVQVEAPVKRERVAPARPARPQPDPIEFVSLPYAPPMVAGDAGQVIRVRMPRQSLRSFGIPVNEERMFDRVPADILMGQDGIARGIRLLRASEVQ